MPSTYKSLGDRSNGGDPNILKIKDVNKIRPLDDVVANWKQHGIQHPKDEEKFASVVCPGPRTCPLCRKPADANGDPQFPISRRFASNVWDYDSGSVKILMSGPQIFEKGFLEAAKVGMPPADYDWTILKEGKGLQTSYSMVRHDKSPFTAAVIGPENLHDVVKYEQPTSVEGIFEKLEAFGIDYDNLPMPSFTLDEALAFVMPYSKHKGLTIEQLVNADDGFAKFLHGAKLEQGQLGDLVFLALQTVLEDRGEVEPLEEALAQMPEPEVREVTPAVATAAKAVAPAVAAVVGAAGMVKLVGPAGDEIEVPEAAVGPMEAAGYKKPEPPKPATMTVYINGNATELPTDTAERMVSLGAAKLEPEPEPPKELAVVLPGGQEITLPREAAELMVAQGAAKLADFKDQLPPEPVEPPFELPGPTDVVEIKVNGNTVPMGFQLAKQLTETAGATWVDERIAKALGGAPSASGGQAAQTPAATNGGSPEAAGTAGDTDPDKPFKCPQCDAAYKTKGALTQHTNKQHGAAAEPAAPAAPAAPVPGETELATRVKAKIADAPFAREFTKLLAIFESATGEQNFNKMNEEQLIKLEARLDEEIAKAAAGV